MERTTGLRAVNLQGWHDLSFLHWSYPAEEVQSLLPAGLTVETAQGHAWVGITPFRMHAVRLPALPPVPYLSFFPEVNCRTYVRHSDGTSGIWFFSLDTPRLWIIAALRAIGLPYHWSRMAMVVEPPGEAPARRVDYRVHRLRPRGGQPVQLRATVEVGRYLDRTDALTTFLTARWWAVAPFAGGLWKVPVDHPDWPLYSARAVVVDADGLLGAAGLSPPSDVPLVHFSPGVRTRLGLPRPS